MAEVYVCVRVCSGGREITVSGRRLNVVQHPYIYFSLNGSHFTQVQPANIYLQTCLAATSPYERAASSKRQQQQVTVASDEV